MAQDAGRKANNKINAVHFALCAVLPPLAAGGIFFVVTPFQCNASFHRIRGISLSRSTNACTGTKNPAALRSVTKFDYIGIQNEEVNMRKYFWLITAFVIIGWGCHPLCALVHSQEETVGVKKLSPAKRVDELFSQWDSADSPGAAIIVVKDGMVVFRGGYGSANLEYNSRISPSTIFRAGSMAKQFTGTAVAILARQGKLSLDDDIRKYLTELPDFGRKITIRHLLHHTSGLRDYWALMFISGLRLDDAITKEHVFKLLKKQKDLNFEPGTDEMYCNTGYFLAAELVGRVTGKSFREWTQENIFQPLGMTSTLFCDDSRMIVGNSAYSYWGSRETGFHKMPGNYSNVGAGGLLTNVEDMANWIRNFDQARVGSKKIIEMLHTKGKLNNGKEINYGLGLYKGVYKGLNWFGHGGGTAGFRSDLVYYPDHKFGVVVLCNLVTIDPSDLIQQVTDIYLENYLKPGKKEEGKVEFKAIDLDPKVYDIYTGYYKLSNGIIMSFARWNNRYFAEMLGLRNFEIYAESETRFFTGNQKMLITFHREKDKVNRIVVTEDGTDTSGQRIIDPTPEVMAQYTGRYFCEELNTIWEILNRDGKLTAVHIRSPDIPLIYVEKNQLYGGWKLMFTRTEDDRVNGFLLSTRRIRNLRFVKYDR
jgi:CubicO group peptidase (beta-lactamase class C family)